MANVLSLVNNHDFVQEVVYTMGNSKPSSIICYAKDHITDLYLHSEMNTIIGVERRTFNLGAAYVTNFVYKNKKVISKFSRDHPIFVGPVFFHWDGSFETYNSFFSHIKARLQTDIKCIDICIDSDDESGLTKALDSVFPDATRLLCTKYIKDNVTNLIKKKKTVNKESKMSDYEFPIPRRWYSNSRRNL